MKTHRITSIALILAALIVFAPRSSQAQSCSRPYFVEQQFPTAGPEETRWRICWQMKDRHGLVITSAHFRKSPSSPWMRVFWDARIGEIYVPYHTGFAFFDVSDFTFGWVPINSNDCPAAKGGTPLGPGPDVCKEVHDRGLAWKDDTDVRRGEEVVLWGVIDAANYNYVVEWTFRDDGVVLGRVGATAQNLPGAQDVTHMHGPIWRLDIDLDGFWGDTVHKGVHTENLPGPTATDTDPMISVETGLQWVDEQFTSLHIHDASLKNRQGHASGYHLMPWRWGKPRHDPDITKQDFWVTRYRGTEMFARQLPTYISNAEDVSSQDVVAWYYGGVHHMPRDEDFNPGNNQWPGVAHVMWTGFMLKPHNLFDGTPLYPPKR